MSDNVLDRFTRGVVRPTESSPSPDEAPTHDDYGAFGWLRGTRDRAIMLELRKKTGEIKAFGYAWLQAAEFDPSDGITLLFPGTKVRIIGQNLNTEIRPNVRLFQGITRHRVSFVQEMNETPHGRLLEFQTRIEW